MNTSTTSDRLKQEYARLDKLCDQAIHRLDRCIALLKQIKDHDTASANAASFLHHECQSRPYDGEAIVVPVEKIFAELEDLEAERQAEPKGNDGHYDHCVVCGHHGNTAHDLRWDEVVVGWVCDQCHNSPPQILLRFSRKMASIKDPHILYTLGTGKVSTIMA
jgi:hypothetical protein